MYRRGIFSDELPIQGMEAKDDKEGFKSLISYLFKIIGDKSSLCQDIKWFFKTEYHNDYNSFGEITDIIQSPHELWEFKYKNIAFLDAKNNCSSSKRPSIMHHLHIITGEDKREISDNDLENIKATHDLLETKSAYDWQHIVWTNNKALMPKSLKKLADIGVQVNELDHYKYSLPKYNFIQKNIAISDVGKAVDIAKLSVIYKFGGVYADLNYKFFKILDAEICNFNFLTTSLTDSYEVENFFFIASKKHPILITCLNDIERNLSLETAPAWLYSYYEENITTCDVATDLFTYYPFI